VQATKAGSWPNVSVSGFAAQLNSSPPRRLECTAECRRGHRKEIGTRSSCILRIVPLSRIEDAGFEWLTSFMYRLERRSDSLELVGVRGRSPFPISSASRFTAAKSAGRVRRRNMVPIAGTIVRAGAFFIRSVYQRVRTGGRAALMRINIWIVLAVLLALLAVTRLSQYQHETQRICADDPSASVCGR
jgi:hypothetical protein